MDAHIFRNQRNLYGFSPERAGANLPSDEAPWSYLAMETMEAGETVPRFFISADEVLSGIRAMGYYATEIPFRPEA